MAVFNLALYLARVTLGIPKSVLTARMKRALTFKAFQRLAVGKVPIPSAASMLRALQVAIQLLPPTKRPLKAAIPDWPGFMSRRYLYEYTVNVHDYRLDKWNVRPFRFSANQIYSRSGAEDRIRNWWREAGLAENADLSTLHFEAVWKSSVQ